MMRIAFILLLMLGLAARFGAPASVSASPATANDGVRMDACGAAVQPDDCCDTRCPADGDAEGRCLPRCAFCSCCPGAAHVVPVSATIIDHNLEVRVSVPWTGPQRTASTPRHIFRPPRNDSR